MTEDDLRPVVWMGDSKRQLLKMPQEVRKTMGFQLQAAQKGKKPGLAKPFKSIGSGIFEICKDYNLKGQCPRGSSCKWENCCDVIPKGKKAVCGSKTHTRQEHRDGVWYA